MDPERFECSIEASPFSQGAEAALYKCTYLGLPAVLKHRFTKQYRHPVLEERLSLTRFRFELKGLQKASSCGIAVPAVYFVDKANRRVIMEFVEAPTARDWIEAQRSLPHDEFVSRTSAFATQLGRSIGTMHLNGLIHGDLTTSNMLVKNDDPTNIIFIDFGLSSLAKVMPEDKGVDLYVLERALESTHLNCKHIMKLLLEGYKGFYPRQGVEVVKKLDEIRLRGRKRDMAG